MESILEFSDSLELIQLALICEVYGASIRQDQSYQFVGLPTILSYQQASLILCKPLSNKVYFDGKQLSMSIMGFQHQFSQ